MSTRSPLLCLISWADKVGRNHEKRGARTRSERWREMRQRERERKGGELEKKYRTIRHLAIKLGVVVGEWPPRGRRTTRSRSTRWGLLVVQMPGSTRINDVLHGELRILYLNQSKSLLRRWLPETCSTQLDTVSTPRADGGKGERGY